MMIRRVRPDEYSSLGAITALAYRQLFGGESLGSYESELLDVGRRDADGEVYIAIGDDGSVLGGVTYVPGPGRGMSEFSDPDAAGIRMLAVDPERQGSGVGSDLTAWCIELARSNGRKRVVLHSTPAMTIAHGIYERLGFVRSPEFDEWVRDSPDIEEPLHLMSFTLEIRA
jgi:ribosomal protein S18 acetylase RimI-like enzyme